jgi:hypothetical protein
LKLTQEIENLSRPVTGKKIAFVSKNKLLTKESADPDGLTGEYCQTFKE